MCVYVCGLLLGGISKEKGGLGCLVIVRGWVGCRISHYVRRRLVRAESVAPQRRIHQDIDSSATTSVHPSRPLVGLIVHVQRRLHFIIIQYFPLSRRFARDAATLAH